MLVTDISVNRIKYIDSIYIHRIDGDPSGKCKYRIEKPKGFEKKIFVHDYSDGYFPLLCRCLNYLNDKGYKPLP
jgi:hypothetical protein